MRLKTINSWKFHSSALKTVIMGLLLMMGTQAAYGQLNKLSLLSGEEIRNAAFIQILDDSLMLKMSMTGDLKRVALDDMDKLLITRGAQISRIDLSVLSLNRRIEILSGLINERTNAERAEQIEARLADETFDPLIVFLSGGLIILLGLLWLLLRRRPVSGEDPIKGVEEMAQTAAFWSEWHKGRVGNEELHPSQRDDEDPKPVD